MGFHALLRGSWVVISGVIIRVAMVLNPIRGLTTPFITTPEPPSMAGNVALEAARWVSGARAMDRTMFGREVPEQYPETPISLN